MPNDGTYDKVDPESPDRCHGITPHGQCLIKKVPGMDFCQAHASRQIRAREDASIRLYNLAVYQQRVDELKDHPRLKTLNNEIGLIRLLVEQKINACKDSTDLLIASQGISQLIMNASQLVLSAAKLEQQTSQTLTKAQVDAFAGKVIDILSHHVSPEILEIVAEEIAKAKE